MVFPVYHPYFKKLMYNRIMFNKHFMKTIILFAIIILIGLVGVLIANALGQKEGEADASTARANTLCDFEDCA